MVPYRAGMSVGAVVVHHRAWPRAERTIDALLSGTRRPDDVVVVDNASGDGSAQAIQERFSSVDVVEAAANRGAAAAMNLGTERLLRRGMKAVLLLTADCVLAPDALGRLVARLAAAPAVGAVGPLLARASAPAEVFSAGGFVEPRTWDPFHAREPPMVEEWADAGPRACEWLDGACVLVRGRAFRQAGPFDENYFHYFDDVDHHLRLRAQGWTIECVPQAIAWQEPGRPAPELWVRNRLRFVARHAPPRLLIRELGRQAKHGLRDIVGHDRSAAAARARGVVHFLRGHWGPLVVPRTR